MSQTIQQRLTELGYELPVIGASVANYLPLVRSGNQIVLSGQIPLAEGGGFITGRLGESVSVEDGRAMARRIGVQLLLVLMQEVADVDDVSRVVKLTAFVNSTPDFGEQPEVTNGRSDVMVEVFGERGKHARAAVGVSSLPRNVPIEIEAIFEVPDKAA